MALLDMDQSGEIDYTEFVAATMSKKSLLSREKLKIAFSKFDTNDSGTITSANLRELLGKFHHYD